jgi:hypothetical protein
MPGSIPVHGICSTDLSRKSTGYRSMFASYTPKTLRDKDVATSLLRKFYFWAPLYKAGVRKQPFFL